MNPVDEYLEKWAGSWTKPLWKQSVRPALALGAVGAGLSAGVFVAEQGLRRGWSALTKKRDFDEMMHQNPGLREKQRRDPKMFAAFYNSLRRMNPRFAADPIVAGTYMAQMSEEPQTAGNIIVNSLGGAKDYQDLHGKSQFISASPIKLPSFGVPSAKNKKGSDSHRADGPIDEKYHWRRE
jgi:hypothetical protein